MAEYWPAFRKQVAVQVIVFSLYLVWLRYSERKAA